MKGIFFVTINDIFLPVETDLMTLDTMWHARLILRIYRGPPSLLLKRVEAGAAREGSLVVAAFDVSFLSV